MVFLGDVTVLDDEDIDGTGIILISVRVWFAELACKSDIGSLTNITRFVDFVVVPKSDVDKWKIITLF